MKIESKYFYIRDLEEADKEKLVDWTDFEDPIFYGYNYSDMTRDERDLWYTTKKFPFRSRYFAVIDYKNDHMIAFLGMKEINRFLKSSKLGIVMDAKYVSKGLGKTIMDLFLDYYFGRLKMKRMALEVNEWNTRALKLYKKLGFRKYSEYLQKFENQDLDLGSHDYDKVRNSFVNSDGVLYSKIYKMTLSKKEYEEVNDENRV